MLDLTGRRVIGIEWLDISERMLRPELRLISNCLTDFPAADHVEEASASPLTTKRDVPA